MTARKWLRWLAPLAALAVLALVFRDQMPFLGQALRELRDTRPGPVLLGMLAALGSLAAMGEVMRHLLRAGKVRVSPLQSTGITLASNAWSTTVPGGPAFSAVLTFQVQRRWGASIALCSWFFVISSVISTMWLVLIGLGAVLLGANIGLWSLLGSFVAVIVAGWAVYWASQHPDALERWTRRVLPAVNRILRREPDAGLDSLAAQFGNLNSVRLTRPGFAAASAYSLLNRLLDALILWLAVWAVTGDLPWLSAGANQTTLMGVLLAYITAKLAGSAQVTPAGLGTVEAAIIATLVATGMTAVDATGAAIIYRVVSFAFVTVVGWVVYFLHYAGAGFAGPGRGETGPG